MYNITMRLYVTGVDNVEALQLEKIVFTNSTESLGIFFRSSDIFYHDPEEITGYVAESEDPFSPDFALAITSAQYISFFVRRDINLDDINPDNKLKVVGCSMDIYDTENGSSHSFSYREEVFENLNNIYLNKDGYLPLLVCEETK